MRRTALFATPLLALGSIATVARSATPAQPAKPTHPSLAANYGKLPLSFEANRGQSDPQVKFLSRGAGYSLFLTDKAAVLALTKKKNVAHRDSLSPKPKSGLPGAPDSLQTDVVRMELVGSANGVRVEGAEELPGRVNYFVGSDPAKWQSNLSTYARVKYSAVYPGVDLVYYGNQGQLEYDFVVAPGADAKPVRLHFDGAERLKLNADGDLTVAAKDGEIAFHKPVVYQLQDGQRQPVEGSFALLAGNTVSFRLGSYDRNRELVIDPVLAYSTFLSGPSGSQLQALAVDGSGNTYVTGSALGPDFPVTGGAYQKTYTQSPTLGIYNAGIVTKLNASGSALIFSTYIGGTNPSSIAIDALGNAYITGVTEGSTLPVTKGAFQGANPCLEVDNHGPIGTAFVTELNSTGSALLYSTYLGGTGVGGTNNEFASCDFGTGIAVDKAGSAFVTGWASSTDFPVTAHAYQKVNNASLYGTNGFVSKLSPDGSSLAFSTYVGGASSERPTGIAVDASGSAYISGKLAYYGFPVTQGAFSAVAAGGVVTKLKPDGSGLVYSTYLGGSNQYDEVDAIAVDDAGSAYLTGVAISKDFPVTAGAFQTVNNGNVNPPDIGPVGQNSFVTKLNPSGTGLVYSSYLGGYDEEDGNGIAVDGQHHAIVTGWTISPDFPVTPDAFQTTGAPNGIYGPTASFLTVFNDSGSGLIYSTFFNGIPQGSSMGLGAAVDRLGNAYLVGQSPSNEFPVTPGAFQTQPYGPNSYVAKFALNGATTTLLSADVNPQQPGKDVTFTAVVASVGGSVVPGGTVNFLVDGIPQLKSALDGNGEATFSTGSLSVGPHAITASYYGDEKTSSSSNGVLTETISGQVAAPVFFPLGGTYRAAQSVALSTPTAGATIYYTTNGATPTTSSTKYTAPVTVSANGSIKAIAAETGLTTSATATATYKLVPGAIGGTTTLASSANPSTLDEAVTFTATVKPTSGPTPTGSVAFRDGGATMAVVPLTNGVASYTTSALSLYGHSITAVYTGSATNAEKGSPVLTQVVNP